ncbi:hypothetical protein [Curtanaerobium respiraculi]|uniref:hypothetical protein n=1 Tax=Curtanaerobium respiraculi TaxID=2949669 RepID=UPI0024B3A93F|nr:hypothetical protein [Curtanaerobium respiraculi]
MAEDRANPPFYSLAFTLVEAVRGRSVFRMVQQGDGLYSLHVEQGSGGNPKVNFTREVPQETAQHLKDALQEAGVFGWDGSYGAAPGRPTMRWTLNVVFKKDVFSLSSGGGSDVPAAFGAMMEQFYRLDLPRPEEDATGRGPQAGASWLPGMDFSKLSSLLPEGGLDGFALEEMQRAFQEAAADPAAFTRRMQAEFRSMPPAQQAELLDALEAMGMASRGWWENFLGGGA